MPPLVGPLTELASVSVLAVLVAQQVDDEIALHEDATIAYRRVAPLAVKTESDDAKCSITWTMEH